MEEYDVIVIGGGPGGYVCAIRAAQLGLKTACVEGRGALGGTCLNVGCIPSKALLHASELVHETHSNFGKMGITASDVSVDIPKMLNYKNGVVKGNTAGIEFLFKKNKVTYVKGWGKITAPGEVTVDGPDAGVIKAKNIVIATGSEPATLPGVEVDEKSVVTSTGCLDLTEVPEELVVIGAGVIGLELGSVWKRLGSNVTVVEFLDQITPGMDAEVCKNFQQILKKQGINFILGAAVQKVEKDGDDLHLTYKKRSDDSEHTLEAGRGPRRHRASSVHRRPRAGGAGRRDGSRHGQDRRPLEGPMSTGSTPIGDVIAGPMLAHKAEDEGMAVAEQLAGPGGPCEL